MSTLSNQAAIPNPALEKFAVFIGEWRSEGTHPMLPGVTLHGHTEFKWIEGGAFLMMTSDNVEKKIPASIIILGSDNTKDEYFMLHFDDRKVSRKLDVTFKDNVLKWKREGHEFSQRYTFTISDDGNSIISKGEMCKDGKTWEKDLDLNYTRLK